jgi:hypothetical protein
MRWNLSHHFISDSWCSSVSLLLIKLLLPSLVAGILFSVTHNSKHPYLCLPCSFTLKQQKHHIMSLLDRR